MKPLSSSLLQKMIQGYRITKGQSSTEFESPPKFTKPLNTKELAETYKLPVQIIERIYTKAKEIETNLTRNPTELNLFKSQADELEKTAINSGAYIVPEVTSLISHTKRQVRDLELASAPSIDPIEEVKKELEELEHEKEILEEAKKKIMEKYYNREIDESSIKNIMDNYEQRLVETDVKIKNLREHLSELKTRPHKEQKTQGKTPAGKDFGILSKTGAITISAPGAMLRIANLFKPPVTQTMRIEPPVHSSPLKTEAPQEIVTTNIPEGFEIPQPSKKKIKITSLETEEETPHISLAYPLIPKKPVKGEPVFAYAKIFWDETNNRYVYNLIEPQLTGKMKEIYKKVKEMLEQRLDIDFSKLKKIEAHDFLDTQVDDVLKYFNFALSEDEKKILKYYMTRDFTGLEMIEPLLQDPNIEDISCDGVGIPLFVFHRNPEIGSIATNITFDNSDELDSFIIRLAQLCGKSISVSQPLLDGTLPDGSRVQVTLGTDIARRGSNLTIRKFTEEPLTPVHLMNYGTLDAGMLAYLWFVVDYGRSILVSGGTASGKTSLLNVLSLFIRPEKKIVSIEDTAELRLPHPHWVPVVARTAIGVEGRGEVDMFELLRESLRQRPDYIIVGEVRGKEAYILFQQMSTGHPSLATIHAENIARLTDRLTTPPISLPAGLISTLDIVVFLARMKYKNKFIRKVTEVVEIVDFNAEKKSPVTNKVYKWNPTNDKFEVTNKSISLKKISDLTGIGEKDIKDEIERRIVVLEWMKENNILDYRDVHRIFSIYYTDPERLLSSVQGAGW